MIVMVEKKRLKRIEKKLDLILVKLGIAPEIPLKSTKPATPETTPPEKIEVSYTDPQKQFLDEMREQMGLKPAEEEEG